MKIYETQVFLGENEIPYLCKEKTIHTVDNRKAQNVDDVFRLCKEMRLTEQAQESVYLFYLNVKSRMISYTEISRGTLNASMISEREICQSALLNGASGVIMVHNHPTGDCTASKQDIEATQKVAKALSVVGIKLLDHIIVGGKDSYMSFYETGILPQAA